jgi:hypothetical protein
VHRDAIAVHSAHTHERKDVQSAYVACAGNVLVRSGGMALPRTKQSDPLDFGTPSGLSQMLATSAFFRRP